MREDIKKRLNEVYDFLKKEYGYNVVYVGLYGSQNYGLDTEDSDMDFVAYIIPSFDDLFNKIQVSKQYGFKGGKISVRDIRVILQIAKKLNPVDIEVFMTEWHTTRQELYPTILHIRVLMQEITRKHIDMMFFEAICTMNNLHTKDNKQIANLLRYRELLSAIHLCAKGDLNVYEVFNWIPKREEIMDIKTGKIPLKEARKKAEECKRIVSAKPLFNDALSKKVKTHRDLLSSKLLKDLEDSIYKLVKGEINE